MGVLLEPTARAGGHRRAAVRHIGNLRGKVEDDPANPRWIVTVRGFGYKLMRE
ncbi:winged helix-turn-helix domain-containing protein [Paenibacillus antri]|uniref:winged helix-turn-helix domain-containing protein n=1 Tax=Paenibacillus antri TaxID=2582848 RepID=UPI003083B545